MAHMMAQAYQKVSRDGRPSAPGSRQYSATIDDGLLSGFIHHPSAFPLSCKRLWFDREKNHISEHEKTIGLCFRSEKYLKPGIKVEISIPLRGEVQIFRGKVVLVRTMDDHFEIGMWLTPEDVHRARVVEQICHIETYLRTKRHQDGPFVNDERVAEEWVNKYAAAFPSAG
jgi:hypothetical protein